ncbi:MAG: hypothetical protein U9M89_02335 [Patescibacteria group bacterium]|nr:hypothetical protein [Patescibacteria group bacterium]
MKKQTQKLKIWALKLIEGELTAILAVSFVLIGIFWVQAAADTTDLSFTITDSGTLTVTSPNGGEDWQVDSEQDITWDSTGSIANVKIEIQRASGGVWSELIASTSNDGGYPWVVTEPTTEEALVRITSTQVAGITDTSDAIFTISEAPAPPPGGGEKLLKYPAINSVIPLTFHYLDQVTLDINGIHFDPAGWVEIGQEQFSPNYIDSSNLEVFISSNTFIPGDYYVCAYSSDHLFGCYHLPLIVTGDISSQPPDIPPVVPPTTGGEPETYKAIWMNQSDVPSLQIRDDSVLWVDYKNTGTATWFNDSDNPSYLGTVLDFDRTSLFYDVSWVSTARPTLVNKTVPPGAVGRFEFEIRAPWIPGSYTENFGPVAEGITWLEVDKYAVWEFNILPKTLKEILEDPRGIFKPPLFPPIFDPKTPDLLPKLPSTGGELSVSIPQEPREDGTLVFIDEIEQSKSLLLLGLAIILILFGLLFARLKKNLAKH